MNKKGFLSYIIKNLFTGSLIVIGGLITIFGVIAFENMTTSPVDTGNQSLNSPILSKTNGVFDRNTMSLEAIAKATINWNDCEYKVGTAKNNNTTISCSPLYILVDHSCSVANNEGGGRYVNSQCSLSGVNSLFIKNSPYLSTSNYWATYGSIKCCKTLAN